MKKLLIFPLALISVAAYSSDAEQIKNHSEIADHITRLAQKAIKLRRQKGELLDCSPNSVSCLAFSWRNDAEKAETTAAGSYLLPNGKIIKVTLEESKDRGVLRTEYESQAQDKNN